MTIIVDKIEPSSRYKKRFKAILSDGKEIHFGQQGGQTYIDHHDKDKRKAYQARHYGNKREKELIDSLTLSPALLSMFLLWGYYETIEENLKYLNAQLSTK